MERKCCHIGEKALPQWRENGAHTVKKKVKTVSNLVRESDSNDIEEKISVFE